MHAIGARAERRVERQVISELKRATGETDLPFGIAGAAVAEPDGTVRDVVFPVVGEQTSRDPVRERQSGPTPCLPSSLAIPASDVTPAAALSASLEV